MISDQNRVLPFLGADIRPLRPDPRTAAVCPPAVPPLPGASELPGPGLAGATSIQILDIAQLFRDDPEAALALADGNAATHWASVRARAHTILHRQLIESVALQASR